MTDIRFTHATWIAFAEAHPTEAALIAAGEADSIIAGHAYCDVIAADPADRDTLGALRGAHRYAAHIATSPADIAAATYRADYFAARPAHFADADIADAYRAHDFTPDAAAAWATHGYLPGEAAAERALGHPTPTRYDLIDY